MLLSTRTIELSFAERSSAFECFSRRACAVVVVLCAVGCKLETKAMPTTQIVVDVHADAVVRDRTAKLQLDVRSSADHSHVLGRRDRVLSRTLPQPGDELEESVWPMRLVFTPRAGDSNRVFQMSVTARDANGAFIARTRVITSYVKHEARYVGLRLEAACVDVSCAGEETCSAGACQDAWLDPTMLPHMPGKPRGVDHDPIADAGPDAGDAGDAGSADAAADAEPADVTHSEMDAGNDAGPEAGDAGIDASVLDRCLTNNGGCDPLVTCRSSHGVVACGQCPNGFEDPNGDGTRCTDVDECKSKNGGCDAEHGKCTNSPGGYECKCEAGYHGNGRECSVNVPCAEDPSVCDTRATCAALQGKQMCTCGAGFEGDGGQCRDVDECTLQPARCGAHAKCVNTEGSFECACDSGWMRGGEACVDIDECTANTDNCTSRPNACLNTPGSFMCKCPKGYTGPAVGSEGCNDTDECYEHMANCSSDAQCMNTRGSFTCTCKSGFTGDGVMCRSTGTGMQ
jgi:EGF domain/Calcium-binding EGF domain